jgi:hypothetical protein
MVWGWVCWGGTRACGVCVIVDYALILLLAVMGIAALAIAMLKIPF